MAAKKPTTWSRSSAPTTTRNTRNGWKNISQEPLTTSFLQTNNKTTNQTTQTAIMLRVYTVTMPIIKTINSTMERRWLAGWTCWSNICTLWRRTIRWDPSGGWLLWQSIGVYLSFSPSCFCWLWLVVSLMRRDTCLDSIWLLLFFVVDRKHRGFGKGGVAFVGQSFHKTLIGMPCFRNGPTSK